MKMSDADWLVDWLGVWPEAYVLLRSRKSTNADRTDGVRWGVFWFTLLIITALAGILCHKEIFI
jgi:hypothetical protein